mgnify:CR=1 FL=1
MSDDWRGETVDRIRTLITQAAPEVVEETRWRKPSNPDGVPTFSLGGLICTLETYRDKVKVTFAKGASIDDPHHVFNASLDAGTRRAVDLRATDALDEDAFVERLLAGLDFDLSPNTTIGVSYQGQFGDDVAGGTSGAGHDAE